MAGRKEMARDFKIQVGNRSYCRKSGNIFTKSGFVGVFAFPIGRAGMVLKIGKIPPESGKLARMFQVNIVSSGPMVV